MTLRAEIRGALLAGPKTAAKLAELCDSARDDDHVAKNLYVLKSDGKVKYVVGADGKAVYSIAKWPEKAKLDETSPPPKRGKKKRKGARTAVRDIPFTDGDAASAIDGLERFSIDDRGVFSIRADNQAVDLAAGTFARMRQFIERTKHVWTGE